MSARRDVPETCAYPRERLLAWRDGVLHGAQREVTELHLATCASCRAWLDVMDDVDRILRDAPDPSDDRPLRERIKQQASTLLPANTVHPSGDLRRRALAATALVTILIAFIAIPGALEGGSSFTRLLRSEPTDQSAERDIPGGTALAVPDLTAGAGATVLPFGLVQVGTTYVNDTSTTRSFRRDDGLALSVTASRMEGNTLFLSDQPAGSSSRIVGVNGRDVLLLFGSSRRVTGEVIGFAWVDGETQILSYVVEQPEGGLTVDATIDVAGVLMALDWGSNGQ